MYACLRFIRSGSLYHFTIMLIVSKLDLVWSAYLFHVHTRIPHAPKTQFIVALTHSLSRIQGSIDYRDVLQRALFVDERGDLADKRLLIVGDDDLFSVVAALSGEPALIVVCTKTLRNCCIISLYLLSVDSMLCIFVSFLRFVCQIAENVCNLLLVYEDCSCSS